MQSIQRLVDVLDTISDAPDAGASITDLCRTTSLPKGTMHRLLEGLREYDLVVQEEDSKKWRLGPRAAFWAGRYLEGPASLTPLAEFTRRLSRETGFFAYLTVLDRDELICVATERPNNKAHFFVQLGSRIPVLSTAGARALLAHQPEDLVRRIVERAIASEASTRLGVITLESYLDELDEVRSSGYAKCIEELEIGVSALGAPVTNTRGHSVASLTAVAPTPALAQEWEATTQELRTIANEASTMRGVKTSGR